MKISYGKANIVVLLISLILGGTVLFGVNRFYISPLREERKTAEIQLQNIETQRQTLRQQKSQLEALEGIAEDIEDLPTLIPFGDLQPESLLATLAEAAETASIVLIDQRFGMATPIYSSNSTEESEAPTLMRTSMTLTLEGDNEEQFQEFIRLLEETPRLIQVESFSLNQTPANQVAFIEPVASEGQETDETDSVLYLKGGVPEEDEKDDTERIDENGESDSQEEDAEIETDVETSEEYEENEEMPSTPNIQSRTMRANVTIVIYFFES